MNYDYGFSKVQLKYLKVFLIGISLITGLSIDIYLPSMNSIQYYYHVNYHVVQLTMSVYLAGFALGQLLWGTLSDSLGRAKVLLLSLTLYLVATMMCMLSHSIMILVFARFIQAVSASCVPVSAYAIARDVFDNQTRKYLYSYISSAISLVPIFAPLIGSYLELHYSWRSSFAFLLVAALLAMLPMKFIFTSRYNLSKSQDNFDIKTVTKQYLDVLINKKFICCNLAVVAAFSALFAFISNSSHVIIDLMRQRPEIYPKFVIINAMALFFGGIINSYLIRKYNAVVMLFLGSLLLMIGSVMMLFSCYYYTSSILYFIVAMSICSFAVALVISNGIAEGILPFPTRAGAAVAALGFSRYLGAFAVANMISAFSTTSYVSIPICNLVCAMIIFISTIAYRSLENLELPEINSKPNDTRLSTRRF